MGQGLHAGQARQDRLAAESLMAENMELRREELAQRDRLAEMGYSPFGGQGSWTPQRPRTERGPGGGLGVRPGGGQSSGSGGSLWDLIDATEGGGRYDTLFGYSNNGGRFDGVDVSTMTLGQLREFSRPDGEYGQWVKSQPNVGRVATPMGRYQIVGTTLRQTQEALGLSDDTVFNRQTQDQMADYLARQRLARASTMGEKMRQLRAEWEGFRHVSDADLAAAIRQFEQGAS